MNLDARSAPGPIELVLPANSANAVVLRIVAATLAAHLDYSLDRVDDLRIIADEFFSLVIDHAQPDEPVILQLAIVGSGTTHMVHLHSHGATHQTSTTLDGDLRWTLLTALANDVILRIHDGAFDFDVDVAAVSQIPRPDD